jgi:hypothetical protein
MDQRNRQGKILSLLRPPLRFCIVGPVQTNNKSVSRLLRLKCADNYGATLFRDDAWLRLKLISQKENHYDYDYE